MDTATETGVGPNSGSLGTPSEPRNFSARLIEKVKTLPRPRPELVALLILAAILNLWALGQNGWANDYYSAAVRSMSGSWHNFFYNSYDAAGVMTVDKPPVAFWVQALSVRVFGYSSLSMLIPQALMGVATVGLVYDLTRRTFGRLAGTIGGFVFALTPITVAIFRHNNPDAILILFSVAALWFVVRGLEDGRTKWLLWAGAMVGLAFETKMGAGLLVMPGLAVAWLWVAPAGRVKALKQLFFAGLIMVGVGLAWPMLMWLTPADSRPWISGTSDNSIWSLITGYNGLGRLDGQAGGPGGMGGGGGMGSVFGGPTGVFRLVGTSLGGQAGWLLGLSAAGGLLVAVTSRFKRTDPRTGWILATGGAFLVTAVAFSFASGIFHPYYVSLLAPFAAALIGAGVAELIKAEGKMRYLAIPVIALAVVGEIAVINSEASFGWMIPLLIVGGIAAAALLVLGDRVAALNGRRLRSIVAVSFVALMMIAPATWAVQTLGHPTSSTFPAGGPESQGMGGPGGGFGGPGGGMGGPPGGTTSGMVPPTGMTPPAGMVPPGMGTSSGAFPGATGSSSGAMPGTSGSSTSTTGGSPSMAGGMPGGMGGPGGSTETTPAIKYIGNHGGGNLAVSSQQGASTAVIEDEGGDSVNVVAIGGFSGRESQVSTSWLAGRVDAGQIRWVLTDGSSSLPADGRTGSTEVMAAVASVCKKVDSVSGLYDCSGLGSELAAS